MRPNFSTDRAGLASKSITFESLELKRASQVTIPLLPSGTRQFDYRYFGKGSFDCNDDDRLLAKRRRLVS